MESLLRPLCHLSMGWGVGGGTGRVAAMDRLGCAGEGWAPGTPV